MSLVSLDTPMFSGEGTERDQWHGVNNALVKFNEVNYPVI